MILIEQPPENQEVARFVDRYQLFIIEEAAFVKTVPNGKIELFTNLSGSFASWDWDTNTFSPAPSIGFLPATNKLSFIQIPEHLICLNIKFHLSVLSLSFFEGFLLNWQSRSVNDLLGANAKKKLASLVGENSTKIMVPELDTFILEALQLEEENNEIRKLIFSIENDFRDDFRVTDMAKKMNMTPKTLERRTKKHFGVLPKELWRIFRFESVTSHIKKSEGERLIDALGYGYYDQSHFARECKKITGYSPRDFFSKLKLSTNDLLFEEEIKPKP